MIRVEDNYRRTEALILDSATYRGVGGTSGNAGTGVNSASQDVVVLAYRLLKTN